MSEEFGPDFITVTDEDGNDFELEHLGHLEYNNEVYMAFFPAVSEDARRASPLTSTWMTRSTADHHEGGGGGRRGAAVHPGQR